MAIRCLQQLTHEFQKQFPEASAIILRDFFVDDIITGCETESDASLLKEQLTIILKHGGFELSKWASNKNIFCNSKDMSDNDNKISFDKNQETKTLGIFWDCQNDSLFYKVEKIKSNLKLTKIIFLILLD